MEEKIIAQRIKKIRTEKELTLEDVAKRTGLTKGLLSKIENNKVSPPISTLVKIAKALSISLGDLFSSVDAEQIKLVRKEDRLIYNSEKFPDGYVVETLVNGFYKQKIEPLIITIVSKTVYETKFYSHPGQEFIFVLEGSMKYFYANQEYQLFEGDCLYFNAENEHGPLPVLNQSVKYLSILCP